MTRAGNTKMRALTEAKKLVQEVGFNGFSFQHIADALQIKKPSLYAHFKSKEDLGKCLIEEVRATFAAWAETVEFFAPAEQIGALFEASSKFSADSKKLCPISSLVADLNSLPKGMRPGLTKLYNIRSAWLKKIIEQGQSQNIFRSDKSSDELVQLVLAAGMGAQLCARISGNPNQIREIKQQILDILTLTEKTKTSRGKRK